MWVNLGFSSTRQYFNCAFIYRKYYWNLQNKAQHAVCRLIYLLVDFALSSKAAHTCSFFHYAVTHVRNKHGNI